MPRAIKGAVKKGGPVHASHPLSALLKATWWRNQNFSKENPMNKPPTSKTAWEKSAQNHFRKAEQTETNLKQVRRKERVADAAKTEKLRALRLAKEAQDKLAAETEAQTNV